MPTPCGLARYALRACACMPILQPRAAPHAWLIEPPCSALALKTFSERSQWPLTSQQSLGLQDDKLSGLFSIVKDVHTRSTEQRLQVDISFTSFKELLLAHSVQRPPYSTGLFTLQEMKDILNWMLDTYYRHYKLYMYAFTDR